MYREINLGLGLDSGEFDDKMVEERAQESSKLALKEDNTLLFLIHTVDLPRSCANTTTQYRQFGDDTTVVTTHNSEHQA